MQTAKSEPKQIHIKLEAEVHQALKLEAAYSKTTIQDLVVDLIKQRILHGIFSNMLESE